MKKRQKSKRPQTTANARTHQSMVLVKKPRKSRMLAPRQAKIIQMAAEGKSQREISRRTGHSEKTIAAVLRNSEQMKQITETIVSELYGDLNKAKKMVSSGMGKDYEFAYKMLERFGALPSPDLRNIVQAQATSTGIAQNLEDDKLKKVSPYLQGFAARMQEMMIAVSEHFEMELPKPLPPAPENPALVDIDSPAKSGTS